MTGAWRRRAAGWPVIAVVALLGLPGPGRGGQRARESKSGLTAPVHIAVMDPLADRLACACVQGHAQRRYDRLAGFLAERLDRPVHVVYGDDLGRLLVELGASPDFVVGKQSVILYDAAECRLSLRSMARLTDQEGRTGLTGWFVVRKDDPAKRLADLKGRRILFGPRETDEKHAAALVAARAAGIRPPERVETSPGCNIAALAVVEREADAAVISSYAFSLLEGCETIDKGALRVIGKTEPVPFVTLFATARVTPELERDVIRALATMRDDGPLLAAMESADGFVRIFPDPPRAAADSGSPTPIEWTDWRGPRRDGKSPYVPTRLPAEVRAIWRVPLTGMGLSGIAATSRYVLVSDKDREGKKDVFRCLHADTGRQLWTLEYAAAGEMDYGNAPRATPVVHEGLVYLLGAFGHLHCVELDTGMIVWKRDLLADFAAELVTWGMCSTPLLVDDKLVVNPGAKDASLVALDRHSGRLVWKTPGGAAAYASFILATFGGVRQIVGYDAESLGGWEPDTGRRLWRLVPECDAFNVPTPVAVDGRLLVATENNGTRLYGFDSRGRIRPDPLATNKDLAPDTSTPVVVGNLVFGCTGNLYCLDLNDGLRARWTGEDEIFEDYVSLTAGNGCVLITAAGGEIMLVRAAPDKDEPISRWRVFEDADVWSHPALLGNRLYIRNKNEIACLRLDER